MAYVIRKEHAGHFDRSPELARYQLLWEALDDEPARGVWTYFGSDWMDNPEDVDLVTYVFVVGAGALADLDPDLVVGRVNGAIPIGPRAT